MVVAVVVVMVLRRQKMFRGAPRETRGTAIRCDPPPEETAVPAKWGEWGAVGEGGTQPCPPATATDTNKAVALAVVGTVAVVGTAATTTAIRRQSAVVRAVHAATALTKHNWWTTFVRPGVCDLDPPPTT